MALYLLVSLVFTVSIIIITTFYSLPTKKLWSWFLSFYTKTPPNSHVGDVGPTMKKEKKMSRTHDKGDLRRVFMTFDKDRDGFITKRELRESLENIGVFVTETQLCDMVEKVDSNGDGLIDFHEFCQLLVKDEPEDEDEEDEEVLKEAFDVFDGDKDGLITEEELGFVLSSLGLKEGNRLESCKEMIKKVDLDGDGMVNFDEFKRMMKTGVGL